MLVSQRSERYRERLDDLDVAATAYARHRAGADPAQCRRLRDAFVCRCLPFADRMARRYGGRTEPIEDLQQVARIGLVNAVDRYDPARGSFTAFAVITITGELKRHFRDRTWDVHVTRRLQDLSMQVGDATAELTHALARQPTAAEIAARLHVGEDDVREAQACAAGHTAVSLSTPVGTDGSCELVELMGGDDTSMEVLPDRLALAELLLLLPARSRHIIALRFYGNLTQTQIAAEIGVSQMHVSRLLRHALTWLRAAMLSDVVPAWPGPEQAPEADVLQVQLRLTGTAIHVTVIGEIDRDVTDRLWRRLNSAVLLASPGRLVIDMAGVPLVDVAGARVLRDACMSAAMSQVSVTFTDLQPHVTSVLALVGLPIGEDGRTPA